MSQTGNRVDQIYKQASSPADFAKNYLKYIGELAQTLDSNELQKFIELLLQKRKEKKTVFFIGNGGSAATASHFMNDLAVGTRTPELPFKAMSLTDNNAVMTCIANDWGYDKVFVKQLEPQMQSGDALVALSASGNSPNIIEAIHFAKKLGCTIVGISGFDGGKLKELSDIKLHVQTAKGEYGPVEDLHMVIDHLVSAYLCRKVLDEKR